MKLIFFITKIQSPSISEQISKLRSLLSFLVRITPQNSADKTIISKMATSIQEFVQ